MCKGRKLSFWADPFNIAQNCLFYWPFQKSAASKFLSLVKVMRLYQFLYIKTITFAATHEATAGQAAELSVMNSRLPCAFTSAVILIQQKSQLVSFPLCLFSVSAVGKWSEYDVVFFSSLLTSCWAVALIPKLLQCGDDIVLQSQSIKLQDMLCNLVCHADKHL